MQKTWIVVLFVLTLGLLVACGASQLTPTEETMATDQQMGSMADSGSAAMDKGEMTPMLEQAATEAVMSGESDTDSGDVMMKDADAMSGEKEMMALPAWATLPLVNARTGETFTLANMAGKTLYVEPMATWCTNCRRQLENVRDAQVQLDADKVVFIGLSVETNLTAAELVDYADKTGFNWLFAVMTPEMLRELSAEFGQTIANPPSTPHFLVLPDGTATELVTGFESAAEIVQRIQAVGG